MRTISTALLSAQQSSSRVAAIRISINDVDYSDRLLFIEHHEEAYRDYATIHLNNSDRALDAVNAYDTNLLGYRFRVAYGYYTGEIVAEPNGDGAGKEYVDSPDMWVKNQHMISAPGQSFLELYCEGQWSYAKEKRVMALADSEGNATGDIESLDPNDVTTDPYFLAIFDRTKTVYELLTGVLTAMGWTLSAAPSPDDEILTTFKPYLSLEALPYAATVLRDNLIAMTKCYLRAKANLVWEIVYPQSTDVAVATFYSSQAPYFLEFMSSQNILIPNRIVVFANDPLDEYGTTGVWPQPVMVGDTGEYTGNYTEIIEAVPMRMITVQEDADKIAAAILARYKAEQLSGYLVVYHDCRLELYDKIDVVDTRGY
jgi:hypothetical protein